MLQTRSQKLYFIMGSLFIADTLIAEVVAPKSILVFGHLMSSGVLMWPLVFILTDLINEYYGSMGVKFITYVGMGMIAYLFMAVSVNGWIPAEPNSWVDDTMFQRVFGSSLWIMGGSIAAFLLSQLVDVGVFHFIRRRTKTRFLWLRATGSTVVSQFIDTFVVLFIAFYLSGFKPLNVTMTMAMNQYVYKFMIAVAATPFVYIGHYFIDQYLGAEAAHHMIERHENEAMPPGPPIA